jgi:hypothetical protein
VVNRSGRENGEHGQLREVIPYAEFNSCEASANRTYHNTRFALFGFNVLVIAFLGTLMCSAANERHCIPVDSMLISSVVR